MLSVVLATFFTYHILNEIRNFPQLLDLGKASSHVGYAVAAVSPPIVFEDTASSPSITRIGFNWTALAAMLWVTGVSVMVLRTIVAVVRGNQFSSVSPIKTSKHLELLMAQSQKLGLKCVPSFWSSLSSRTPYTVGVLAPAIVVPVSMLTSLSSVELQAVLAHELAHIRRNDYLANLFQMVVEAVYFFNPAVWWISRQVRVEREACCDQVAIETSSSQLGYATILAKWMETVAGNAGAKHNEVPATGLAFADKKPSGMLERIQRILKPDSKPRLRVSLVNWVLVIAASLLIACVMNVGSKAVTTVAVQALSDTERVARIEEKRSILKMGPNDAFEKGVAKVSGRITTEDGGEVESGWIYSTSENTGSSSSRGEGDFKGNQDYEVAVKSGIVRLKFFSKNYAPAIIGPIKAFKGTATTEDVTLVKGKPHLIHVVGEAGEPVSGASVQMRPKSHLTGGPVWKTSTDDSGNYTFVHRNPGKESRLSVEKYGYDTHREVVTNNGRTNVTLFASPFSKGVVISADGTPVANAKVISMVTEVRPNECVFEDILVATTDKMGKFETPLLSPTGIHEILVVSDQGMASIEDVKVSKDLKFTLHPACSMDITIKGDLDQLSRRRNGKLVIGFSQETRQSHWQGDTRNGALEVVEDSEDLVRVKLSQLLPGSFLLSSGKFKHTMEAKLGNHSADVIADKKAIEQSGVEMVNLKVNFQCDGGLVKPSGSLGIGPRYGSFSPLEDGVLRVSVKPDKYWLEPNRMIGFTFQNQYIDVEPGHAKEVTIEVDPAGAVSGTLVDANGEPVSAAVSCKYEIRRPEGHQSSELHNDFHSDSEGNFLLTPIPIGAKVIVKAGDRFNPAVSEELMIEAARPVVDVKLKTASPAEALVRAVDHEGNPLPGVDLSVELLSHRFGGWGGSLATNAQGEMVISPLHPTWDYSVTAKPRKGFTSTTVALVQGETNILKLEPGSVVRGQLVDQEGNPVSRRRVYALFKDPFSPNTPKDWIDADRNTDSEGRFEFTRLPKTECEINSSGAEPVLVNADVDDQPIELRLKD